MKRSIKIKSAQPTAAEREISDVRDQSRQREAALISSKQICLELGLVDWNALLLSASLALIVIVGEDYMRLTTPSMTEAKTCIFIQRWGSSMHPTTDIRVTNRIDFWTAFLVNSQGFLDREHPDLKQSAEGCLIAMIGDSVVAVE